MKKAKKEVDINMIRKEYEPDVVLTTWRKLLQALPLMNEAELKAALRQEVNSANSRGDMVDRLRVRYVNARKKRLLKELQEA